MLKKLKDLVTVKKIQQHIVDPHHTITDDDIRNAQVDFTVKDMITNVEKSRGSKGIEKPRTRLHF